MVPALLDKSGTSLYRKTRSKNGPNHITPIQRMFVPGQIRPQLLLPGYETVPIRSDPQSPAP